MALDSNSISDLEKIDERKSKDSVIRQTKYMNTLVASYDLYKDLYIIHVNDLSLFTITMLSIYLPLGVNILLQTTQKSDDNVMIEILKYIMIISPLVIMPFYMLTFLKMLEYRSLMRVSMASIFLEETSDDIILDEERIRKLSYFTGMDLESASKALGSAKGLKFARGRP